MDLSLCVRTATGISPKESNLMSRTTKTFSCHTVSVTEWIARRRVTSVAMSNTNKCVTDVTNARLITAYQLHIAVLPRTAAGSGWVAKCTVRHCNTTTDSVLTGHSNTGTLYRDPIVILSPNDRTCTQILNRLNLLLQWTLELRPA
jgi:hypothetical protein